MISWIDEEQTPISPVTLCCISYNYYFIDDHDVMYILRIVSLQIYLLLSSSDKVNNYFNLYFGSSGNVLNM